MQLRIIRIRTRDYGIEWCDVLLICGVVNSFKGNYSPILMDISPMAQVALLQTEMNSGFKFDPRIGIKSAAKNKPKLR